MTYQAIKASRNKSIRLNCMCHYIIMLIIILFYTCISVKCDADPNANPGPNADPDALWDKLPALQKAHGTGKLHSLRPIQSFISPTQGRHKSSPITSSRHVDSKKFSMHNIFPLSLVPKPIRNMQNMFSFSKLKSNKPPLNPQNLATNKTLWRQLDNSPRKPMKTDKRFHGAQSNGFSRLVTFSDNKDITYPRHDIKHSPKPGPHQLAQPKKDNSFRESALALFGGNADYGWKKVEKSRPSLHKPLSIEQTIQRQEHLNSLINAYKNNSLSMRSGNQKRNNVRENINFSQNMKPKYRQNIDADDASEWKNTNSDHRKPFNHQSTSVSYHDPSVLEPFQGQNLQSSNQPDVGKKQNRKNHAKPSSTIYGKRIEKHNNNFHSQKSTNSLSMSSSIPLPTVKSTLNRRLGSIPFRQGSYRRMDDDDLGGVDGGLLSLGNQIGIGNRLLASKKAVNVLSKVREIQDEIKELNKQIAEENMKFKVNNVMTNKELKEEMKLTTSALLSKDVKPTAKMEIEKEKERKEIISSLSDSKKSIIEMLSNSDSTPASNLGDALKMLLKKRQQRQEKEQKNEIDKQQRLLDQRELEQRLKEEEQKQKELEFLRKQKQLLSAQQSKPLIKQGRTNFEEEREKLVLEIQKVKKKQKRGRSKRLRKLVSQRFRASDKEVAQKAHLRLALNSNKRIINKIERLKEEKRQSAALRQKQMIDKQLNELNALRILQRKRLQNLRKRNNQGRVRPSKASAELLQLKLKQKLPPSSPILKLSTAERQRLLTLMDFERNSEVLQKTNDKIKAKAQKQELKQDATRQTLKVLEEFDEYDDYDLSDGEIDEILLGFLGGSDTFDFDYEYEDYFGDDDLDIYDILYDDYDTGCTSALCRPRGPATKPRPIHRPHVPPYRPPPVHSPKYPVYTPSPPKYPSYRPPKHRPSYHHEYVPPHPTPSTYHSTRYEPEYGYKHTHPHLHHKLPHLLPTRPTEYTTIHGENPASFPPKQAVLQHHPSPHHSSHNPLEYDYYDYDTGFKSGPEFLDEVSGIIGGSEAAGLPPHVTNHYLKDSILHNIQHKIRTELSQGPPNHFRSHVEIGVAPHRAKSVIEPQPVAFNQRRPHKRRKKPRHRRPYIPYSASNQKEKIATEKAMKKGVKAVKSIKGDPNSVSFSEIMADFLTANPLPFKDKNKDKAKKINKSTSKNKDKPTVFVPFKKK